MLSKAEQKLLDSMNLVEYLFKNGNVRIDLLNKYNILASTLTKKDDASVDEVNNNLDCYSVLLNKRLFVTTMSISTADEKQQFSELNKLVTVANSNVLSGKVQGDKYAIVLDKLASKVGGMQAVMSEVTPDLVSNSLMSYGLEVADDLDDFELEDGDAFDDWVGDNAEGEIPDMDWDEDNEEEFSLDDLEREDNEEEFSLDDLEREEEEQEEARKQSLERGDVSGKANDLTNADTEDSEELKAYVENIISNIMSTYFIIYEPLFLNPPRGVLYTNENTGNYDIMCVGRSGEKSGVKVHNIPSIRLFISSIYKAILNNYPMIKEAPKVGDDGMYIKASWMNKDGTMIYNYAPHIQVRNCMGVYRDSETGTLKRAKNWSEFKTKLSKELKPTILALLKRVDINNEAVLKRAVESIQELYTTIFLVNEFDKEKVMRFTVYSQSISLSGTGNKMAQCIVNSNPLSKPLDSYEIMNDEETKGLKQILIVTDKDKYRGEINFGYKTIGKVIQAGGSIDISHAIVGTDLTGKPVEVNLNNNAYTSIGIVAGSRSGKGVLTLSLLASMLAAKCPVVYLDYKPDMAGAFWKLERQVPGSRILAIDGQTNKLGGLTPVRNYRAGYGCPQAILNELSSEFNVIPYIKGVQLMNLIGKARVMGSIPKKKKMFFILDEAQKCGDNIADSTKKIEEVQKTFKPKGKDPESDEYKYLKKLYAMYKSTATAATEFLNTNAGSGNMSALVLGQQADATNWRGPFSNLVLKCPIKFLGNGTKGGSKYGLNEKTKGVDMLGTGYFGLSMSNTPTPDTTTMIKTTMVLNDADFDVNTRQGGEYTGALLSNITNNEIKQDIIDNDMIVSSENKIALEAGFEEGTANPLVGFPGLIQYIGSMSGDFDLASALSAGYNEVEAVLKMLGIVGPDAPYKNVEAYMYSGKEDSLFTSNQLGNALNNNMTIYDYIQNGVSAEDDNGEVLSEDEDIIDMYGNSSNEISSTTSDEDDETLDFGAPSTPVQGVSPVGNSASAPMSAFEQQLQNQTQQRVQQEQPDKSIKFMPTSKLRQLVQSGQMNDATIEYYFENKLLVPWRRGFNLANRVEQPMGMGLKQACITYSSMWMLSTLRPDLVEVEPYMWEYRAAKAQANNGSDLCYTIYNSFKKAYDNNTLRLDTMPSVDIMRTFAQECANLENQVINNQSTSADTGEPFVSNMNMDNTAETDWATDDDLFNNTETDDSSQFSGSETNYAGQTAREADFDRPFGNSYYTTDNNGNNRFDTSNMRNTSDVIRMPVEAELVQRLGFLERIKKSAYESSHGMSYMMTKYWDHVLQSVANRFKGDRLRIDRFAIITPGITANSVYVGLESILGGEDNIEMREIVNIQKTFKKFPNIKELVLDAQATSALMDEYGSDAKSIWKLFQENKKLQRLVLMMETGERQVYDRASFAATAQELDRTLKEQKAEKELEVQMTAKHPRLSSEPNLMYKAHKTMIGNSTDYFKKGHDVMVGTGDKKIRKWVGYTLGGIGAVAIGGILGIPHLIQSKLGR